MNPKIEEIAKNLRGCALDDKLPCDKCAATGEMTCSCRSELMLIAADLIEQLQQELIDERFRHERVQDFCVAQGEELSKLKTRQRWIPVTERLPDNRKERVIVMIEGAHNIIGTPDMDTDRYITGLGWVRWNEYVTHWMPLPERPQEE